MLMNDVIKKVKEYENNEYKIEFESNPKGHKINFSVYDNYKTLYVYGITKETYDSWIEDLERQNKGNANEYNIVT